jgi:hypothetical protein
MNIHIAPKALEWLQDKGNQITLDPIAGGG